MKERKPILCAILDIKLQERKKGSEYVEMVRLVDVYYTV